MVARLVKHGLSFGKRETVLCVSVFLALLSCCFVPPDLSYLSYVDWDTLALLFSLMAVMKGLQRANFFACMADGLLKQVKTTRALLVLLVFLPFLFSMVITNDVALIAFVPFGLTVLRIVGLERLMVPQVALQTLAANLGSMLTPMGNPQNLYLYNQSGMGFGAFCRLMIPYVLAAAVCLAIVIVLIRPAPISVASTSAGWGRKKGLLCYAAGFLLCLFGVFKLLSPLAIAAVLAAALLLFDRKILRAVDYSLLGTFLAFFIFVGNVVKIPAIRTVLSSALEGRVPAVSILVSQIISNVPAALLLSGFTDQWRSLIVGCNLGGLGTLIASMASLISYKMVVKAYPEQRGRYFRAFTALNAAFLLCLFCLSLVLSVLN